MLLCPAAPLAGGPASSEQLARKSERGLLRVRNTTPYILSLYVAGVRAGWIRPYRTELFRGLRDGYHRVYAVSEYGSAAWGPRDVAVPGNINVVLEGRAAENAAMTMASRVFNANKASLLACDKLAERRGESVNEARVEFQVEVDAEGKSKVTARGEGAAGSLLSCYRTMVSQWKYPATGSPYSLSFSHVH
jgi:hypothetical protein